MPFTRCDQGTHEDWIRIEHETAAHQQNVPGRVLALLRSLENMRVGFACDQLHHSLMAATLSTREGATDEEILVALLHDVGKAVSIANHGAIGAAILRPYVSHDAYMAVLNHMDFEGRYFYRYFGKPEDAREKFRGESWFPLAEKLADCWDMPAFDPHFPVRRLGEFEPLIHRFFATAPPGFD